MKKYTFNERWLFRRQGSQAAAQMVTLPHDAMLAESRSQDSPGGTNISWFQGGLYIYEKEFSWPGAWPVQTGGRVLAAFEGVYRNATVSLNGKEIVRRPYGYIPFYADLTDHLKQGKNTLRVEVDNSAQPNSRWYTGSGIYRPVTLCLLPGEYIRPDSLRITPTNYNNPEIRISVETSGSGTVRFEIMRDGVNEPMWQASCECCGRVTVDLPLPGAELWSPENPVLYRCRALYQDDSEEVSFGVRIIECDAAQGLRINGNRVILRGACIHHDNGLLGAVAEPFAEARKVRLLKEAGYNALRSAHNPCSRALLEACDRQGMLMMDEFVDMWYIHKTKYDYANDFDAWWRQDLGDMVVRDYNHPSVILYSIGNEVSETGQARGIALTKEMRDRILELDKTRPVTCGVNIFFNYLSFLGFGVYSDKKAEKSEIKPGKGHKAVGSEFFNNLAGFTGAGFMKFGATLHGSNVKTRDAFAALDVAGYNYGINRYAHDVKQYPNRVIVGSETFCADAYAFWERAKKTPALIGDFVWAGMDYLGEAGIGSWEYKEYAPDFSHGAGWITAGSGRLDITGKGGGESLYTQVAFEQMPIAMAVVPVSRKRRSHSPSAWKLTNAIPSWSWRGLEGARATVEVYTRAPRAALYLNGKKVAEKKRGRDCRLRFNIPYQNGCLEARAIDANGQETARTSLTTAAPEICLSLLPEQDALRRDELAYVRLRYTDRAGVWQPTARGRIALEVQNGTLLGLGHACPYNEDGYLKSDTDTYYGEAMAIIRPTGEGAVGLKARSPYGNAETALALINEG